MTLAITWYRIGQATRSKMFRSSDDISGGQHVVSLPQFSRLVIAMYQWLFTFKATMLDNIAEPFFDYQNLSTRLAEKVLRKKVKMGYPIQVC